METQAVPEKKIKLQRKLSIPAGIWICLCLALNLAFAIVSIVLFSSSVFKSVNDTQKILMIVFGFVMAAGYLVLLFCQKAGFYTVLTVSVCSAICAVTLTMWISAIFCLLNPVITWLLIRSRWNRWEEIEEHNRAIRQQTVKPKRKTTALLLAALPWTGFFGIDRFYLGYVGWGLFKFWTGGGFLVLYIIDIVKIAKGTMTDRYGRPLKEAGECVETKQNLY